jgi:hypothetical protein
MEELINQLEKAIKEYKVAQNNFDNAEADYIDTAIYNLKYREEKLMAIRQQTP